MPSLGQAEVEVAVEDWSGRSSRCMWWVRPAYEVCLSNTTALDDVHLKAGRFTKRQTALYPSPASPAVEAAFMHFQEWKKAYPDWYVVARRI